MSENNVNGITGAEVTTTGIIGATVAIGQYIINDYVITIAQAEDEYGYTMTITKGTQTQTVTLYGLTPEQYDAMLSYLEQAQAAAQSAQSAAQSAEGSASDADAYMEVAINAANTANTQAGRATQASNTAQSYASQAQTAKQGAETAKTDAQTARTQAQGYRQAAEAAATRAETAAGEITGMTAEAETIEPGSPATASFLDGVLSLGIPAGETGNGIVSIIKTGTQGNVDTYTITYTNGTTSTFTVTNGTDGAVQSVAGKTGTVTLDAGDVSFDDQQSYDDGTVGAGLADLKSALDADEDRIDDLDGAVFNPSKNIYKSSIVWGNATFVDGVYTPKNTGRNDAAEIEYIPVSASENYVISWKAKDLPCKLFACGYNANKEPLTGYVINNATMNVVTRYVTFTTPVNCVYIRLRIFRSNDSDAWNTLVPEELQIEKGTEPTEYKPYEVTSKIAILEDTVEDMQEEIDNNPAILQRREVASDKNLLNPLIVGYLKDDGSFSTMSSWRRSDYIPVTPRTFMYFYNINQYSFFGYFNASKTWIGGKNEFGSPVTLHNEMLVIHTVPENAAYMIVSLEDTKAETCWGNYTPTIPTGDLIYANTNTLRTYAEFPSNPCDYSGMDVCTFRSGICIGDSITGGGFNYSSGTNPWRDGNIYSYPSQFEKMTGIEMTNEGHSGLTSVQWWAAYGTGGEHAIDFSGHDFAIIHLGINDVSYFVDIEDTEDAYQNIIDALKYANEGIKIFVCTIIPAYADAEHLTPYAAVNALVQSFASQENVYCCDLTTYGHEYTVSEYTAGHLTAYGYWRMAKDLISYIGYIMRKYPAEFRFIQYIGTDMQYTPGQ